MSASQSTPGPVTPSGLNHLVLNVRNLEESHAFWTEVVGFKQVGELKKTPERPNPAKMRFYSADRKPRAARAPGRMGDERHADGDQPHRDLLPEP